MTGNRKAKAIRVIAFCIGVLAVLLAGTNRWLPAQQREPQGPPQFTTYPIHSRMVPSELENGHVIFVPPVAGENLEAAREQTPGGNGGGGGGSTSATDLGGIGGTAVSSACPSHPVGSTNFDATCALNSYQGEPMLAAGSGKFVGGQNDIYPGNCSSSAAPGAFGDCGISVSVSSDGQSWQRFKLTRNWGGHNYLIGFDPSVARDSQGNFYAAYGVADGGVSGSNGVVVARMPVGSTSWVKANPVVLSGGSKFEDKYWIAADATTGSSLTDRVYVAWDRNQGNNQILMVARSADGGQTWSSPAKINDGTSSFERVIYAFPAVAPNHTVHVLWLDYARNKIFIDKSTNGGVNWGTDVAVATTNIGFGADIGCNGGRSMSPAPQMAIFPNTSSTAGYDIYVAYANQPSGTGQTFDVFVTRSTNAGASWSAPQRVTVSSAGHQYNPAISIDSNNSVNVSYLDRREDTTNNCLTNTYLSRFTAGVAIGTINEYKISDAASNFNGNPNGPGDYSGSASTSVAHPYFADHRNADSVSGGGFEVYTAAQ